MYFMQHRDMHVTTTPQFTNTLLILCQSYNMPAKLVALAPNKTPTDMYRIFLCNS